jgi:Flp pilus assembly protein TadD
VAAGWPTGDERTPVSARSAAAPAAANRSTDEPSSDEEAPVSSAASPRAFKAIDSTRAAGAAYQEGDFATALAQLESAAAESPNDPEVRNNLGQLLVRQGRSADALPHFDVAVRIDGSRWNYRFNRARAYGLLNRWPEAVAEYRVAAQAFPGDHATLYNLGLAQLRVRDYAAAATSLEQAVAAAPAQHDFLITLGTAYVGAEQTDRARATFQRFLELAPDDPEVPKVKALLQALADAAP